MTWRRSPTSSHSGPRSSDGEALREAGRSRRRGCRALPRTDAADAVGGDEVARTDGAATGGADGHAVVAAGDRRDLDATLQTDRGERGEVLFEDALELVLRHAGGGGRADDRALVGRRVADLDRLAGRGAGERRRGERAPLDVERGVAHLRLEAPGAQQLHRRGAGAGGARRVRAGGALLHHQRLDARAAERDRGRQPARAGADDEHLDEQDQPNQ